MLRRHFALARKHGLPVLMHCYRAHPALVELLKEEPFPEAGLLLHSYSGGRSWRSSTQKGCYFSFAGPVTLGRGAQAARRPARRPARSG